MHAFDASHNMPRCLFNLDDSNLGRVAHALAESIESELPRISNEFYGWQLFGEKRDFDKVKMWDLQLEDTFFCMHILDRIVFSSIDRESRTRFIDTLVEKLADGLWWFCPTSPDTRDFRIWFGASFNLRTTEYGRCRKLSPEEGEAGTEGTLFWEFGRKMSSILSDYNPVRTTLIAVHGSQLFEMMLEISNRLKPHNV